MRKLYQISKEGNKNINLNFVPVIIKKLLSLAGASACRWFPGKLNDRHQASCIDHAKYIINIEKASDHPACH